MKKIWKTMCACSLALACGTAIAGCGKNDVAVSRDLDNDGIISSWETLFDRDTISASIAGEITEISSAEELLDINNHVGERKVYVLTRNIDLGYRSVCINLGMSELYGNNHIISNFKLGSYEDVDNLEDLPELDDGESSDDLIDNLFKRDIRCLFYGGTGVHNLRLFMGLQQLSLNDAETSYYYISPFVDSACIDNVNVKGKLDIKVPSTGGRTHVYLQSSLLYSQSANIDEEEELTGEPTQIQNVNIDGSVIVDQEQDSQCFATVGMVASQLSRDSSIYNAYVQVDAEFISAGDLVAGGVVGQNWGFVSSVVSTGTIKSSGIRGFDTLYIGGIAGENQRLAEIKNSSTNINLNYDNEAVLRDSDFLMSNRTISFGGIAGCNNGGILHYAQSDANIKLNNDKIVCVGGLTGRSDAGIISYALCRGSIDVSNVKTVYTAQACGYGFGGLFEKIIATTSCNVDNSQMDSTVNVGMLTIFEDVDSVGGNVYLAKADSPYFRNILIDGVTSVFMRDGDTFRYELGLRNKFRVSESIGGALGDEEIRYVTYLPEIYNKLYYTEQGNLSTTGFQLYKYVVGENGEKKLQFDFNKNTVSEGDSRYALNANNNPTITKSGTEIKILIDNLDFKNFLNHNEVNLDKNVPLSALFFTLKDEKKMESYFGGASYNGELAYFDREFDKSYKHIESALGSCDYDGEDEFLSFMYNLIYNPATSYNTVIKIYDDFLNYQVSGDEENNEETYVNKFIMVLENVLTCLNITPAPTITEMSINKENIDESSSVLECRYVSLDFTDANYKYNILFDVSSLNSSASVYAIYVMMTSSEINNM